MKRWMGILLMLACLTAGSLAFSSTTWAQSDDACGSDVTVQAGNTLSSIAARYPGVSYQQIVAATNAAAEQDSRYSEITNASLIRAGWTLCIPASAAQTSRTPAATVTSTRAATATATPLPPRTVTATPAITSTAAVSATTAVSPSAALDPDALYPLQIEYMRQQEYPGSELVIEQTLSPGANYNRYVASYQSEGNKIFALLTIPQGNAPDDGWPIVLFNHGYIPPEIYRTTDRYIFYTDAFSRAGYIVFKSDYRGHGSSEGEAGGATRSYAYTADVLNAMAALKRLPEADPERIGMWGHSMGGQITLRAMVVSDEIKAGVIWAGSVGTFSESLSEMRQREIYDGNWARRTGEWREELTEQFGTPEENPEFWASITPNNYVADLSGPVQLQHGTADYVVPLRFSDQLEAQILDVDGEVEYFVYDGDDHNLLRNLQLALSRSVAFFDEHVKQ